MRAFLTPARAHDAAVPWANQGKPLPPEVDALRAENTRLRRQLKFAWGQVADLKRFLNDYGMVWVGEQDPDLVTVEGGAAGSAKPSSRRASQEGAGGPSSASAQQQQGKRPQWSAALDVKVPKPCPAALAPPSAADRTHGLLPDHSNRRCWPNGSRI